MTRRGMAARVAALEKQVAEALAELHAARARIAALEARQPVIIWAPVPSPPLPGPVWQIPPQPTYCPPVYPTTLPPYCNVSNLMRN